MKKLYQDGGQVANDQALVSANTSVGYEAQMTVATCQKVENICRTSAASLLSM